ncbi:MAG: zinc ribbon domain-containing protein [Candidatus Aminicenantaceae bacterium]
MFFFIGGVQPKKVKVDKQPRICPNCSHSSLYLSRIDHYLSIFFIPLFPVKKGPIFLSCENCGAHFDEYGQGTEFSQQKPLRKCPYCGRPLEPDFDYCPSCGKKVTYR